MEATLIPYYQDAKIILLSIISIGYTFFSADIIATPMIALREAQNCAGCHNPGRSQRPVLERRCTLDCQGCHVDPAGSGPRNQWGYYYSQDQMAMINFFKPQDPLQDTSRFDLHLDTRIMQWSRDGDSEVFPMAFEPSIRIRPFITNLHLTYQALLLGRLEDKLLRVVREGDRRFREKYSLMVDALPLNSYVRAYRGTPMYGLKRPNHSLWIRQRIGLDQFATTDAFEVGGTPNVPFFRYSLMKGDPYVDEAYRQKGSSFHGGARGVTLAWHVNTSLWKTSSDYHEIDMNALGAGFNAFNVIVYGEKNWRWVKEKSGIEQSLPLTVYPTSTIGEYSISYGGIRGLMFGVVKEDLQDPMRRSSRISYYVDLHPIPYLQFEIWKRDESGDRNYSDYLSILHLYADF